MTVSVDAVVYFNVIDAELALCSVDDFRLIRFDLFYLLDDDATCPATLLGYWQPQPCEMFWELKICPRF